jgi:exosortase A
MGTIAAQLAAQLASDTRHDTPKPVVKDAMVQGDWSLHLWILGAAWAAILLLFWRDATDMALIWWNSSTFNHCLLILPILGWLVIQRKDALVVLKPKSYWPALLYVAAGSFGWLVGDAAGLGVARQLGLLMMLQGSVVAVLGLNVARGLLFPLFYMLFLLPVGEEAVPALQTLTAKMCMIMLDWANIPAQINGIFITTPTGYFKVAEACSGVKFLIAMIALGALVCNQCFSHWGRRAVFMAACVIVPILANGMRAFGTIYIAHYYGVEFASGFDHVFYGWIFFAVVIALVMAGGWRFFDRMADDPPVDTARLQYTPRGGMALKPAIAGLLCVTGIPVLWSSASASQKSPIPVQISLPQVKGWQEVPYAPKVGWRPYYAGANHTLFGRYRNANGQMVDLYVAVYDKQSEGRELIGFGQGAVSENSDWAWSAPASAPENAHGEQITAPGPVQRDVISFYRVNGVTSGSAKVIKLAAMKARLFGGNQQAVAVMISAEHMDGGAHRAAMTAFMKDLGSIDNLADHMAGLR